MSVLGMGPMEILVVLVIAFIVLGPDKMVTAARMLGRATGELRRMAEGLPQLTLEDEQPYPPDRPIVHRGGGPDPSVHEAAPGPDAQVDEQDDAPPGKNGPVAFKPAEDTETDEGGEEPQTRDTS